ncbi:hypothetical protein LINGRAHAP2_LOCUS1896 [Linum grandiflorum]
MGSLLPPLGEPPKYAQLYVFDPEGEMEQRFANFSGPNQCLLPAIMNGLQIMLDETNVLVQSFRQIHGLLATSENRSLRLRVVAKRTPVERQYELPTGTELAGLIPDDFQPDRGDRDIIIHSQQSGLVRISTMHPKFDALHLPLLFPHGNDGFHSGIAFSSRNGDVGSNLINIPPRFLIHRNGNDLTSIVDTVYPQFGALFMSRPYIKERAIMTSTNKLVSSINDDILALIPGSNLN